VNARLRRRIAALVRATAAVAAAVAVATGVAVLVLGRLPSDDEQPLVLPALATAALSAALVGPVRRSLRTRRTSTRSPEEVLAAFGDRASRGVPMDDLLLQLADALRSSLGLRRAEVWVADGLLLQRRVSVPDAEPVNVLLAEQEAVALTRAGTAGEAWLDTWAPSLAALHEQGQIRVAPARHGGALLGAIVVERESAAERFDDADDRQLGDLGRRLGDVLRTRELDAALQETLADLRRANEELRASRARLVAAADAERRRIERDLHDGAQQHLVALAVHLGLLRDLVTEDPDAAAAAVDELAEQARETVQQLRDLAHGIYPPLLADAGLAEALRAAGRRSPLAVRVEGDPGRAAADVEAAVYFCCLEALGNAAKHAPSAAVSLALARTDGWITFDVVDDGPGFDPTVVLAGHGMQNMADRLGAVGGAIHVDSRPGAGTAVRGRVPA
jgi:signal transduction histidine kinase